MFPALTVGSWVLATSAFAGTLSGGETVEEVQLYAQVGYPHLEFGAHLPVMDMLEITPRLRFGYGGGIPYFPGVYLQPAAEARIPVFAQDKLHGAVTAAIPLSFNFGIGYFGGGFSFGLGLFHPGFMMTYDVSDPISLDFGIRFEDDIFFGRGYVAFQGALPFIVGVEGEVTDTVQLGFKFEGGPAFVGRYVGGKFNALATVGFTL